MLMAARPTTLTGYLAEFVDKLFPHLIVLPRLLQLIPPRPSLTLLAVPVGYALLPGE